MPHPPNRLNTLRVIRGQTKAFLVKVKDQDGRPAKLNNASDIRMSVRAGDQDVFSKSKGNGIEVTDAARGIAKVTLSSEDTDIEPGTYRYDLWLSYDGSPPVRDPVIKPSDFIVVDSVTKFS